MQIQTKRYAAISACVLVAMTTLAGCAGRHQANASGDDTPAQKQQRAAYYQSHYPTSVSRVLQKQQSDQSQQDAAQRAAYYQSHYQHQ